MFWQKFIQQVLSIIVIVEPFSETSQSRNMELFAKIVNDFQSSCFSKNFHLKCLTSL